MAIVSYCKKCKQEVSASDVCELCGGKLPKTATRLSWHCIYKPVSDWMAWNAPMRILLPVIGLVALTIIVNEAVQNGAVGIQLLFKTWFFTLIGALFLAMVMGILIYLMARGNEMLFFVMDYKGIHLQQYARSGNWLARALKAQQTQDSDWLMVSEKHLLWSEIRRIHVMQERLAILFYSPKWWLAMVLYCDAETFMDAQSYILTRTTKKKDIHLAKPIEGMNEETL